MPLPPYIRRPDDADDRTTYQTVYARDDKLGSAAAPTAGLHFTEDLLERLRQRGFGFVTVTCHDRPIRGAFAVSPGVPFARHHGF